MGSRNFAPGSPKIDQKALGNGLVPAKLVVSPEVIGHAVEQSGRQ
jgi:hypothetical protein